MTIIIRPAEAGDVAGLFHVRLSVRENALSMAELAALGITPETVTDMIATEPCAWVAVEEDRIVGFSMIDAKAGSLFAAFVLPGHEGRGIGRQLVAAAERQLRSRHAVAWLETGTSTRAEGFYRRLGWRAVQDSAVQDIGAQDIGEGDIRLEKRLR